MRTKEQIKEYNRAYRQKNKKKRLEYHRKWKKTEAGKLCIKRYRSNFKIKLPEYKNLIDIQNNLCAICFRKQENKSLAIDHCHLTGKVRGLLCSDCNIMLGFARDNVETLKSAVVYLSKV